MTKDGSTRGGLRSLFGRRGRSANEHSSLTPLTIYQPIGTTQAQAPIAFPTHRVYASSPEILEDLLPSDPESSMSAQLPQPREEPQEEEDLEMLEDGASSDDDGYDSFSPSNSCGDIGGSGPSRRSRAFSRSQPAPPPSTSEKPTQSDPTRRRERSDSVSGSSISSIRSWKSIFRFSQAQPQRGEGHNIKRISSLVPIRGLAISTPVAVQVSTSAVVEIGVLPSAKPPLRAPASSPAMTSQARFDSENAPPPLRNPLDMDDVQIRRQLLHSAITCASQSPTLPPKKRTEQREGLRKRSSSIASLSSLFGAAIGLTSKTKDKANASSQPVISTPGIALSNSITSFTLLSAPQAPPVSSGRKGVLKPVNVQPAVPAVSGSAPGADLAYAPKHSLASSSDAEEKTASRRWKLGKSRKTAEVTAQTFKAMTQSRAVELNEARKAAAGEGPTGSSVSLASSSALGATMHGRVESSDGHRVRGSPSSASPSQPSEQRSPRSAGLFVSVGRWAKQIGGRSRYASSNSGYSQSFEASCANNPTSPSRANTSVSSTGGGHEQLLPAAGIDAGQLVGDSLGSLGVPADGLMSHASSPASLNHWLMDLDLNLRGLHGVTAATCHGPTPSASLNLQRMLDSPRTRGFKLNAFDEVLSVRANNGSVESVVFLIKPTAEPIPSETEPQGGPQPQLSRRNTKDSVRNSLKSVLQERRALSTHTSSIQAPAPATAQDVTLTQSMLNIRAPTISSPAQKIPALSERSSSRNQLPTRTSAVSQLCSVRSDLVSASYDDETEVIAQVDESASVKPDSPSEDVQGMESQQIDPWGSFDGHLEFVADSDSAAAVLAGMSEARADETELPVPSRMSSKGKAFVQASEAVAKASSSDSPSSNDIDEARPPALAPQELEPDESSAGELSGDISATSDDLAVAKKIVIAAVAFTKSAIPKMDNDTSDPEGSSPASAMMPSQETVTQLSTSLETTVEQMVAVTASLAKMGSMSLVSTGSSIVMARNSLDIPEPLTPSDLLATPSLASHTFSTDSADDSSDSVCGASHRAVTSGMPDALQSGISPTKKSLLEEAEHFDQWGSTPNGLLLDLSINGKPSSQHFEDAVQSFKDRQRERTRTQTAGREGWGELSPLLGYNTVLSMPAAVATLDIDDLNELSPVKVSQSRPTFPPFSTAALGPEDEKPISTRMSAPQRMAFTMPRHKSGHALGAANAVHASATMPSVVRHKLALEAKRTSLPGTVVTLDHFLSELKAPIDVSDPPPRPFLYQRRTRRSRTLDAGSHATQRQQEPAVAEIAEQSSVSAGGTPWGVHRRVRTTPAPTPHRLQQYHDRFASSGGGDQSMLGHGLNQDTEGSFTREEWQQFARSGRVGPSFLSLELNPDMSHRAVHTKSPSPPLSLLGRRHGDQDDEGCEAPTTRSSTAGAGLLALIEDYDYTSGGTIDTAPSEGAPRCSTPTPPAGFDSPSEPAPADEAPRSSPSGQNRSTPAPDASSLSANMALDRSGRALSEAPSTALAHCHTPLIEDDLDGNDGGSAAAEHSVEEVSRPSIARLRDSILSGSPVSKVTAGPSLTQERLLTKAPIQDEEAGKQLQASVPFLGSLTVVTDPNDGPSGPGPGPESDPARAGPSRCADDDNDDDDDDGELGPSPNTSTDEAEDASAGTSGVTAFLSSADVSSATEADASAVDLVELLLRKAVWARYEKAQRAMRGSAAAEAKAAVSDSALQGGKGSNGLFGLGIIHQDTAGALAYNGPPVEIAADLELD